LDAQLVAMEKAIEHLLYARQSMSPRQSETVKSQLLNIVESAGRVW